MMRGGEGLLAGLTGGVNILQQKKEEDKENIASIKSFETMMKGLEGIADQLDPKFKEAVDNVRLQVSDPSLSNKQRAQIGAQSMKGITELMKIGSDVKQQQAQAEQNRLINQARVDSERAQMQKAQFEQGIQQLEGIGLANNGQIPKEILAKADPRMVSIAIGNINKLARESAFEREVVLEDGSVVNERIDPIRGSSTRTPKILSDGTVVRMPTQGGTAGDPSDPFSNLERGASGGGGNAVVGSLADRQNREAAAKAEATAIANARAQTDVEDKSKNVINVVEEAIRYVDGGSGGPMDSALSGVGKFVNPFPDAYPGLPGGTDRLKNRIEVLKSNLSLGRLMEMKAASPNGASGLGAVNVKEFEALQNELTKLDASQPEHVIRRDLIEVGKKFAKMAGMKWEGPSSDKEAGESAPTKKGAGKTADEIADRWLRK
jgi:hypothetical protein